MLLQVGNIRVPISIAHCASQPEGVPEGGEGKAAGLDSDEEAIPHAGMEVYRHTLLRGANAGSFLALVLGIPVLLYRGVRKPAEMMRRLSGASPKGVVSSCFAGEVGGGGGNIDMSMS